MSWNESAQSSSAAERARSTSVNSEGRLGWQADGLFTSLDCGFHVFGVVGIVLGKLLRAGTAQQATSRHRLQGTYEIHTASSDAVRCAVSLTLSGLRKRVMPTPTTNTRRPFFVSCAVAAILVGGGGRRGAPEEKGRLTQLEKAD